MRHGLGHLRDPKDDRDWKIDKLLGAAASTSDAIDWSQFVDHVRDQGQTESCVGQAFARAVHLRAAIAGSPIAFPSALAIYAFARDIPLQDQGCYPRMAAAGLTQMGVVSESRWPFDANQVNDEPPLDVAQHGADTSVAIDGYYRIDSSGAQRSADVRQALAAGYPVPFAQEIGDDFENYAGGVLDVHGGPILGGHMTCLVGFTPDYLIAINSWGPTWGESGFYRITDARLQSAIVSDLYALSVVVKGES